MRISKHLHSCLLIEEQRKTILIDPGIYTYEKKALDLQKLSTLEYLLITHEHADHCHLPFIKDIVTKFPSVTIISTPSVVEMLKKERITATTQSNDVVTVTPVNHERVFDVKAPQNVLFAVFGRLAHPGDSLSFTTDKDVLALPLLGPSWMITQAAEKAAALKPKCVLPIHDFHWRDVYRKQYYVRLEAYFKTLGIEFKPIETGEVVEVV